MIKFIRSACSGFCFCVFGVGGLITGVIIFPLVIAFAARAQQRQIMLEINCKLWRFFVWLMESFNLIDVDKHVLKKYENLRGKVIISNHPSLIDIVILMAFIKNSVCVVKGSLAHNFFLKNIVKRIFIINNENTNTILKHAKVLLKQGYNIVIFPEGTRTVAGRKIALHRSFAQIALRAGVDIYPFLITQSFPILGKMQKWYQLGEKPCRYTFKPLKVIHYIDFKDNNLHTSAIQITAVAKKEIFNV